jgi:hypothetical protein
LLRRIPHVPGVYAWHRSYHQIITSLSSEDCLSQIRTEINKDHCLPRSAKLGPLYQVRLKSKRHLGKQTAIEEALRHSTFRESVNSALQAAMLFQAPLYIGKASLSLRTRTEQHLDGTSGLKERLNNAGVDIRRCSLIIIESAQSSAPPHETATHGDTELLFEEILSKLFLPTFTEKYG